MLENNQNNLIKPKEHKSNLKDDFDIVLALLISIPLSYWIFRILFRVSWVAYLTEEEIRKIFFNFYSIILELIILIGFIALINFLFLKKYRFIALILVFTFLVPYGLLVFYVVMIEYLI